MRKDAGISGGVQPTDNVLAVGLSACLLESVADRLVAPVDGKVIALPLDALTPDRLSGAVIVISPLFEPQFDALEMAGFLQQVGYRGRYLAVASSVPNNALIRAEVAQVAPDVSFDVLDFDEGPHIARL